MVPWSHLTPHLEREPSQELQRCIRAPRKVVSEPAMFGVCIHFRPVNANVAMHDPISSRLATGDSDSPTHKLIGSPGHQA